MAESHGSGHSGGASTAGPPVKFFLLFDVKDESGDSLRKAVSGLHDLSEAGDEAAHSVEHTGTQVHSLVDSMEHLAHMGSEIREAGESVVEHLHEWAEEGLHVASEFDSLHAKMIFAFGDGADQAFDNLQTFEQRSAYPLSSITEAVASIRSAFRGVDPTSMVPSFLTATGAMETGLDALSDAAAGAGTDLGQAIRSVEGAMEGQMTSLRLQYRLSTTEVNRIRTGVQGATTDQAKYNAVVAILARHWGGAQAAMSQTYDQLSLRVHSMTEQLVGTIFKPMLDELKPLLIAYHTFLVELRESEHDGHAIGGIFQLFGKIITFVGIQLIKAARAIHKFAAEHPMLVKVLATLVVVGAALTSAIGAGIVMIATIGGAVAAFASAWPMIAMVAETLTTALAGVVPYVVAMAAVGAVLYAAWSHDFGGIRTLLSNVALVVQGLWEAFHHWGYSTVTISAQTGQALANAGILDFFINLVSWIARGIQWARGLWDSLKTGWATVAPVLHAAWVTLSDAFSHLSIILSHTFDHITGIGNAAATTFETSHDKGARFGRILNTLIIPAIEFFAKAIRGVAWVVENVVIPVVNRMITFFQDATDWVHHHSDTVRIALEVITAALGVFAVMGIGSAVAALGSLVVAGAAAIPAVLGLMAPFLVAAAPILATVAAIVAVVEAIRQISALVTELNRQGFQETWRLITGSAPDLDAMRAHHRGVDASDPVTGSSGVHHNEDVPTPARSVIPTADGLTPSTSPPTVSGPTASGDGAGQNSSSHATATAINNMTRVLQQVHVSTQEQTQLMRSGALRPVIGEQAIAVAVENYSSSEGERSGYLGRPRLGSGM